MIKISQKIILETVNSTLRLIHVSSIPAQIGSTSVHTAFLTSKQRKNTHKTITRFLCLIIKNWLTHKKNHLKNNNIQIYEFPACLKKEVLFPPPPFLSSVAQISLACASSHGQCNVPESYFKENLGSQDQVLLKVVNFVVDVDVNVYFTSEFTCAQRAFY